MASTPSGGVLSHPRKSIKHASIACRICTQSYDEDEAVTFSNATPPLMVHVRNTGQLKTLPSPATLLMISEHTQNNEAHVKKGQTGSLTNYVVA
jgi:hypothetical protein